MKNKQSQSQIKIGKKAAIKTLDLVIWAILIVFVLIVLSVFTTALLKQNFDARDAEARVFFNMMVYSQDGISYYDSELGRLYPGRIDLDKIDSKYMDRIKSYGDNQVIAAKVTIETPEGYLVKEAVYNEKWYNRWEPLAGKRGSGASSEITEKRTVSVYEKGRFKQYAVLKIRMLMPNA